MWFSNSQPAPWSTRKRPNGNGSHRQQARRVRTLVIGGAGYIGSVLTRQLLASGRSVRVLDLLWFGEEPLRELQGHPGFELIRGDFCDAETIVRAMQGVDEVVHLGGIVGEPACALDEERTVETNYAATALVTQVARGSGARRLVFASSCSVYGASDEIVDESSPPRPISLYAATKVDSERIILTACEAGFPTAVLRLGTAFGWSPRLRFDLVVNLLTARSRFENQIVIYNGRQWRPFVHVKDIARAFLAVLEAPPRAIAGEVFNAGCCAMNHQLRDLATALQSISPRLQVVREANQDTRNYRVSFQKIQQKLGFTCGASLEAGIRELDEALAAGAVEDYRAPIYYNDRVARASLQRDACLPAMQGARHCVVGQIS